MASARSYQPKYVWFLMLSYCMVLVFANWFDVRLIRIGNFDTDAGTIIFPFSFLISDLITEVYGYQQTRRAIWCGFLFNVLFIFYGQLISHLPSPDYALINNAKFDDLMAFDTRIIAASFITYFISEPLNAYLVAASKIYYKGNYLALRFLISSVIASGVDSFLFGVLAFAGLMSEDSLLKLILAMWLFKIIIELIGLPISVYLAKKLKQIEQLNIFDYHTKFTIFSLKIDYKDQ